MPTTNVPSCGVDGADIAGSHLLTLLSPACLSLPSAWTFCVFPLETTVGNISWHLHARARKSAALTVSLACSRRIIFRLLLVSGAPLGASPERPAWSRAIGSVSLAANAASSRWHVRNTRLTTQSCEARAFYLPPRRLQRGMNVRDSIFKTKNVPREWDWRESTGLFLINKTTV